MPIVQAVFCHDEFALGIEHDEIGIVSSGNSTLARIATSESTRDFGHPARQIEKRESSSAGFSPHEGQRY